jgi:phosphohistidine phosphatase
MKKIVLIRHGKAEDHGHEISDFERSLTLKGKVIANKMSLRFRETEKTPGILISSPAFRSLETAYIFAKALGLDYENVLIHSNLYYKMNLLYLPKVLSLVSEDTESIILFGHNPSFSELSDSLCSEGCNFMPKCSIIGISFNISTWSEIKRNSGRMEYFLKP